MKNATILSRLNSRGAVTLAGVLLFVLTALSLCGSGTALFFSVLLSDGVVALMWLTGATALGAILLRLFNISVSKALFIATAAGLGLGIFSLVGLGLGLLGALNHAVAIGFPLLPTIAWVILSVPKLRSMDSNSMLQWFAEPAGAAWIWLIPIVSLSIASVSASYLPGILWKPLDPHPYDVTGYHLLVPREWFERGRIVPLEHNVYSYFEMNVEMQFLLLMHLTGGPFAGMYACQFLCVGYAGLVVLAIAGVNKDEHRTSNIEHPTSKSEDVRRSMLDVHGPVFAFNSTLAAAVASTVPWFLMLAGVAYVESALMLYTALAIAWAMRAVDARTGGEPSGCAAGVFFRSTLLSGILAGFACGVKITAVPMLLLAVPIGVLIVLMIRRPVGLSMGRLIAGCAALVIVGMLVVSPWLIRNYAWAHNPLFPVGMKALGQDHFDDVQMERFQVAHSPRPEQRSLPVRAGILWRDVLAHWQYGYLLLPVGLVAIGLRWRERETWLILICGAVVLIVWIGFTHLLPRFLVMLIPIAAMAMGRIRWGISWPAGVAILLAAAGLSWTSVVRELWHQPQIVGIEDTNFMIADSPQITEARDRGFQIGLVGDAQAFLYPLPLGQLHYRAVFNIQSGTDDPVKAWLGTEPIGKSNWLLVVNPMEIQRLHETYKGVPALPPNWAKQHPEPKTFFLYGNNPSVTRATGP